MSLIGNAVNVVISIFLMMALGFLGAKRKWFDENGKKLISFLVVRIALPCMIVAKITTSYTRATLVDGAYGLIIPFLSLFTLYFLAKLLIRALRLPKNRSGVFTAMLVYSNCVFVGVPIALALFGEEVLPHTLLFYIANTLFFWTVGARGMRADAQGATKVFSGETLKNLVNPPLIAFFSSILVVIIGIPLPKALLDACNYVGALVTPLSTMFIGTVLAGITLKTLKIDRGQIAAMIVRFVVSPALVYLLAMLIPVETLTRDAFIVQAAMPVMTQVSILSSMYGADAEYATVGVTITTVLSLAVLPVLALILPLI